MKGIPMMLALTALTALTALSCDDTAGPAPTPTDGATQTADAELTPDGDAGASEVPTPASDFAAAARTALANLDAVYFEAQLAILADDAMLGRQNLAEGGALARAHLIAELQTLGVAPAGVDGTFEQPFAEGVNILGRLPGSDPALADEVIVLSGHYDHLGTALDGFGQCAAVGHDAICNGASDNASGVALILAITKALQTSTTGLRRSLLVVFWDAEEDGLLGSTHFVNTDPLVAMSAIAAMFSVDIAGVRIIPSVAAGFGLGMDYSDGIRDTLHAVNAELGTRIYPVSLTFSGGDGARSDHKPFQEAGVPVVHFGAGSSPVYHTASDNLEVVEGQLAMMMARHVMLVTAELANADSRPKYVDGPVSHIDDAKALRDMGKAILEDPEAVGLQGDVLVGVVESFVAELEAWIAAPPQTDAEWVEYQQLIDDILNAVYAFI